MQSRIVAVVDDDAGILSGLVNLLTASGYEPAAYESAEAFCEDQFGRNAICILLDINLRGMSGIDLRRRLIEMDPTLPVIFMTGSDDEATRAAAKAAGCVAYLRKPFSAQMLIDAIEKAGA